MAVVAPGQTAAWFDPARMVHPPAGARKRVRGQIKLRVPLSFLQGQAVPHNWDLFERQNLRNMDYRKNVKFENVI